MKPALTQFLGSTAGGRHGWYMTDGGFKVRKPLLPERLNEEILPGNVTIGESVEQNMAKHDVYDDRKVSLWKRFIAWIRSFTRS